MADPAPAPAPVPAAAPREDPRLSKILEAIAAIDPDDLTPRAALDAVYALKARVRAIEAGD